jgi:hypothetical protein
VSGVAGRGLALQVVYAWGRTILGYRLLVEPGARITMGSRGNATFTAPLPPGFPKRFEFLRQRPDGIVLRVGPGMSGQLHLRSGVDMRDVADVLATPRSKKWYEGRDRGFREVVLHPGDAGLVFLDPARALKLQLSFVDPPAAVPRSTDREPLLVRTTIGATVGLVAMLLALFILAPASTGTDEITQERFTKVVAPVIESPKVKAADAKQKDDARKKKKDREAAMSKRAKLDEGRLGRRDAKQKETVLPKGREDVLREKVQKTGLLAALGNAKMEGSGLGKLLNEPSTDVEQAVNGLAGAKLVAGRGNGGVGVAGTGLGGGGTGFGRIQGSGNLDVGPGRGRGRKGPGLGTGKEKEVSAGMSTGKGDADGGLTREQVARVVSSHKAALQYCYEKELQRSPNLSGAVTLFWVVRPNGSVDRVKTDKTTLDNRDVEGCMERQVKNWTFPKSTAETHVSFPFLFRGAS